MSQTTYLIGDLARLTATFKDINGNLTDTTVALMVQAPDGTQTNESPIVHDSTGIYHFDLPITKSGDYFFRWTGTGALVAVIEGTVTVDPTILVEPVPTVDLTTVSRVKAWLQISSTVDDDLIQSEITAASAEFLRRTGRGPADGTTTPAKSPFVQPVAYDEFYDGNGSTRLFLRNSPIQSVQLLTINALTVPLSTGPTVPGYVIDTSRKSLVLRLGVGFLPGWGVPFSALNRSGRTSGFGGGSPTWDVQNIEVQYTAGFSGVPNDIEFAVRKWVSLVYKKRQSIGLKSMAMAAGAGTTSYVDSELPPETERAIENYMRRALV